MKQIDRLLVTSFIPPFIMTFFIAVFVLIMQFLWTYIDEIIGKGVSIIVILELLFYQSLALVPLALPIATLISSVMVMGGLGERYELASMKSAGLSLWRIMAPLMIIASLIAVFSFVAANWLIPVANLQFKSRLYDIRKQKPMLSVNEGVFNSDLSGFVMRIGKKDKDDKTIHDILIYDHSGNRINDKMVRAADGEMAYSANKRYLIMKLRNGQSYEDVQGRSGRTINAYPYMRTHFDSFDLVFDMQQFQFQETPVEAFKNHQSMMTLSQIVVMIDSLQRGQSRRIKLFQEYVNPYFYYRNPTMVAQHQFSAVAEAQLGAKPGSFIGLLPAAERSNAANRAVNLARNITDYARTTKEDIALTNTAINEYWIEFHVKFSLAFACLMFLFIGAPMGAIIRKGGFGWPILVSILFFVTYMVLFIVGKKLGKDGAVSPFMACWFPNFILSPIGAIITYQAVRDSALLNLDAYTSAVREAWLKLQNLLRKKPIPAEKA